MPARQAGGTPALQKVAGICGMSLPGAIPAHCCFDLVIALSPAMLRLCGSAGGRSALLGLGRWRSYEGAEWVVTRFRQRLYPTRAGRFGYTQGMLPGATLRLSVSLGIRENLVFR